MPTATTYLKSHKRADKRTALQSLKDRFDYGLNPEKLGAVSSYLCDPATAHAEFMLVKNQYQGETDRRAGHGALCYQIRHPSGCVEPHSWLIFSPLGVMFIAITSAPNSLKTIGATL